MLDMIDAAVAFTAMVAVVIFAEIFLFHHLTQEKCDDSDMD